MKNIKDKAGIAKAAPLAAAGVLGAGFWADVARLVEKLAQGKKDLVTPRRVRDS